MQAVLELQKEVSADAAPPQDPLLADLNAEQIRAVTHDAGPLLIVAGAGTGKTTVISRHVAWLISSGRAKPEQILALTFTDKAAGEMTERIESLLPIGYVDLWVSTFHAFCQRILAAHALDIGLPNEFRLLNQTDAYLLVRNNFDKFALDYYRPMGNPTKFIHALLTHFSRAKDEDVHPRDYLEYAKSLALGKDNAAFDATDVSRQTELANAYHTYERLLLENGCLDLSDLMLYTLELFRKRKNILDKYRAQFTHVVVDEFQDTNWAQYELLKMLVPKGGAISVVGDDDQSIYKFRGASVSNILQFKNDFPDAKEVVLTANYRSQQNILDAAYSFIQRNNPNRLEAKLSSSEGGMLSKRLVASKEGKAEILHLHYATLDDEVSGVADKILALKNASTETAWSDFCILVRSNGSADDFTNELRRRGIPHQFLALKGLYAKPAIVDCLSYFKMLDNFHESAAMYRTLSSPVYRIASEDLVRLTHEANKKAESLYDVAHRHQTLTLEPATHATLERLLANVAKHAQLSRTRSVSELFVSYLYDSGYLDHVKALDEGDAREQLGYFKQLLDRIKRFETLHDESRLALFMAEFALERESGEEGGLAFDVESGPDMVRIMTIHAAKGLEFPYVFIVNMVDKRFPSVERGGEIELPDALTKEIVAEGDAHLEEERRLCYVAMTRAKHGLYFSSADDYGGKTKKKLSRFLTELGFEKPNIAPSVMEAKLAPAPEMPAVKKPPAEAPPYFSFTQLAAYDKCPLQYKFAHVLKIPVFGKPQLSFGRTMHTTLERFMNEIAEKSAVSQTTLFGAVPAGAPGLPVTREALHALYKESWQDDWFPDRPTKESYREKGKAILDLFYDKLEKEPPKPLFVEKDFKLRFGSFWLKGKIDRIDVGDAPNEVQVIDYKTGAPKKEDAIKGDDKKQLMLYQIAVSKVFGLTPKRLTYYYLEDSSTVSFLGEDEELIDLEQEIIQQVEQIRSADYTPKPGMHCKFCDFASICDYRA